jgi:hypothetical protein
VIAGERDVVDGLEQSRLAAERLVDRLLRHAGILGDLSDRRSPETTAEERRLRRLEDSRTGRPGRLPALAVVVRHYVSIRNRLAKDIRYSLL